MGTVAVSAALGVMLGAATPQCAAAHLPPDFYGVVPQGDLGARDFTRMSHGGVATLRVAIHWDHIERSPGVYRWSKTDEKIGSAASAGVEVHPYIYGTPDWIAGQPAHPPLDSGADRAAWKAFLRQLVMRYGRGGSFWQGAAAVQPIVEYQIWNEPNFDLYWEPSPSPREYARLVRLSARAIQSVDDRARIMLGGVASVRHGITPWRFLERFYRVDGIRARFDAAALHPFAPHVRDVKLQIRLIRDVMVGGRDRHTPLAITELGWASSGPRGAPLVTTPQGQARKLTKSFRALRHHRREWHLSDLDWFAWQDSTQTEAGCTFCRHAGLFTLNDGPKPAWRAYRRSTRR